MKQTVKVSMVLLGALTVAMWFGISSTNKKKEVLEGQFAQLEKEVIRKESAFDEVMGLITEVEDQIGTIVEKENLVHGQSQEPLNSGKKENIMREIAMIDELIFRSNENIRTLSDKVKSADIKLGVFEKRINALQADLTTRISVIGELKTELVAKDKALALLLVQTDSLSTTINAKVEVIGQKELEVTQLTALNDELNKSYLAVGTFEDLQAKGVIDKEGCHYKNYEAMLIYISKVYLQMIHASPGIYDFNYKQLYQPLVANKDLDVNLYPPKIKSVTRCDLGYTLTYP